MAAQTQFGRIVPQKAGIVGRVTDRVRRLGIIGGDKVQVPKVRSKKLDLYDAYVESKQYDKLQAWDSCASDEKYVPIRKRKPRVIYDLPKRIANTFASKMLGESVFPKFTISPEDGLEEAVEADNQFVKYLLQAAKLRKIAPEAMRRLGTSGSVLIRFRINDAGALKLEVFNSKYCYPEFNDDNELTKVTIKYVYEDPNDLDEHRNPREKWFRLDLGPEADVLFDNPEYHPDEDPIFEPVSQVEHGLGFVQAEWFRTCEDRHTVDGPSLLEGGLLSLFDELNYSWSQSSQAISYAQEPQMALSGMDVDEIDHLIKSSTKAWNLGREGKAAFIEANLGGVERASQEREKLRLAVQDVSRVIMHDPEKMSGSAQSGAALEQLMAPMVDLINEMRPLVEERLLKLVQKMALATLRNLEAARPAPVTVPPGYVPQTLASLFCEWPPVFPETQEDIDKKVQTTSKATSANLISRETGTRHIARLFDIENPLDEALKVDNQKVFNTFGGF